MPFQKNNIVPITQLTSLSINYQNNNSVLSVSSVTTLERNGLVNEISDINLQGYLRPGSIVYNTDTNSFEGKSNAGWVSFGGKQNAVVFQETLVPAAINYVPVFNDNTGTVVKSSGMRLQPYARFPLKEGANDPTGLWQISELGAIQFGDSTSTGNNGVILLDSLTPVSFQENGNNSCTIFSSGLPEGSSSPSATLEINSKDGALLLSRLTTAERDSLDTPVDGMLFYNSDSGKLTCRQNAQWKELDNSGGNVIGPSSSGITNIVSFASTDGKLISDTNIESKNLVLTTLDRVTEQDVVSWGYDLNGNKTLRDTGINFEDLAIVATDRQFITQYNLVTWGEKSGGMTGRPTLVDQGHVRAIMGTGDTTGLGQLSFVNNDQVKPSVAFGNIFGDYLTPNRPVSIIEVDAYNAMLQKVKYRIGVNINTGTGGSAKPFVFIFPTGFPAEGSVLKVKSTGETYWEVASKYNSVILNQQQVSKTNNKYTVCDENIVLVDTSKNESFVFLGDIVENNGKFIIVKDTEGFASKNKITIMVDETGKNKIEDSEQIIINNNYGSIKFYCTGEKWVKL